jgi:hypothetical protein
LVLGLLGEQGVCCLEIPALESLQISSCGSGDHFLGNVVIMVESSGDGGQGQDRQEEEQVVSPVFAAELREDDPSRSGGEGGIIIFRQGRRRAGVTVSGGRDALAQRSPASVAVIFQLGILKTALAADIHFGSMKKRGCP